jgi:hypothetical protein
MVYLHRLGLGLVPVLVTPGGAALLEQENLLLADQRHDQCAAATDRLLLVIKLPGEGTALSA